MWVRSYVPRYLGTKIFTVTTPSFRHARPELRAAGPQSVQVLIESPLVPPSPVARNAGPRPAGGQPGR